MSDPDAAETERRIARLEAECTIWREAVADIDLVLSWADADHPDNPEAGFSGLWVRIDRIVRGAREDVERAGGRAWPEDWEDDGGGGRGG